ncbi:hypothetical protein [Agriterribacter sp.]|uniref:hypothetical protein n=1 Tax=Agriterribacter sp. TaxID=2821509 RepID=UPI002B78DA8B|nr:hypothetical protein [Agriterribacter sp.]HRP55540.1 hypothetical protein [Agriterribacter sp.]
MCVVSLLLANCRQAHNMAFAVDNDTIKPGIPVKEAPATDHAVVVNEDIRPAYIVPGIIPAPATYKAYHYLEYKYSMRFAFTGCIVTDSVINTIRPNNERTIAVLATRFAGLTEGGLQKEVAGYAAGVRRWEPLLKAVIPLDKMERDALKEGGAIWYEWEPASNNDTVVVVNEYLISERHVLPLAKYHSAGRSVQYPPFE